MTRYCGAINSIHDFCTKCGFHISYYDGNLTELLEKYSIKNKREETKNEVDVLESDRKNKQN